MLALVVAVLSPGMAAALGSGSAGIAMSAGIGPDGIVRDDSHPHYVLVHLSEPEAPRNAQPTDDCGYAPGARPPALETALLDLVRDVTVWDPRAEPRISGWYPRCFEGSLSQGVGPRGVVAYEFETGRYYLHVQPAVTLSDPTLAVLAQHGFVLTPNDIAITGRTGVGTEADCETCPPPV